MSDLVEKVAEEMWRADAMRAVGRDRSVPWSEANENDQAKWRSLSRASIAVCAEEMAKVAEAEGKGERRRTIIEDRIWSGACKTIATAIRSMKDDQP